MFVYFVGIFEHLDLIFYLQTLYFISGTEVYIGVDLTKKL